MWEQAQRKESLGWKYVQIHLIQMQKSIWTLPPFTFNYLDYNRVNFFHKLERYIDPGAFDIPGILSKTWSILMLELCVSFVPVGAISYHFLLLSHVNLGSDKGFCRKMKEIDSFLQKLKLSRESRSAKYFKWILQFADFDWALQFV